MNRTKPGSRTGIWVLVFSAVTLVMVCFGLGWGWGGVADPLERGFRLALLRSGGLAVGVGLLAFAAGWPLGTYCGIAFRGWGSWVAGLILLPIAVPGCIRALAVQAMQGWLAPAWRGIFDGMSGTMMAMLPWALPFPLMGAWIAAGGLGKSALEAAQVAGGGRAVVRLVLGNTVRLAGVGAVLGAAGIFGELGADQIMGLRGFGSQVWIALGAKHDFGLAVWRAVRGLAWVLPLVVAVLWLLRCGIPVLGRERERDDRDDGRGIAGGGLLVLVVLGGFLGLGTVLPAAALLRPLWADVNAGWVVGESLSVLRACLRPSLVHPATGIVVAELCGLLLALVGIRRQWDRAVWMAACVSLLLPGVLWNLGWVRLGSWMPEPLRTGGWLVGLSMGVRLAPVVVVFWTDAFRAVPVSAWEAARLGGVGPVRFFRRAVLPAVHRRWILSTTVVSVLVFGDVSAEVLLQAPGEGAFIGHVFAVMDNSSRVMLAAMAAVQLGLVYGTMAAWWLVPGGILAWLGRARGA